MRILIIEDEPGIAGFLKEGLEEEYFAVDAAGDGRKGLELALTNEYDLLLIDWMIPGISGIEVCRRLRKECVETPIIFLTAKDTLEDVVFGLDAGANDYIRKPFGFEELLARIRVQLRGRNSDSGSLAIGQLSIDTASHQIHYGSTALFLTPKEFSLLEFLVRNKEKVCTRSRIIEHVWDIHFDSDTSVIDVYINFLRKKLDAAGCRNLIQTIRGVGYIIREEQKPGA